MTKSWYSTRVLVWKIVNVMWINHNNDIQYLWFLITILCNNYFSVTFARTFSLCREFCPFLLHNRISKFLFVFYCKIIECASLYNAFYRQNFIYIWPRSIAIQTCMFNGMYSSRWHFCCTPWSVVVSSCKFFICEQFPD